MGLPPWFGGAVLGSCRGFGGGRFAGQLRSGMIIHHPSSIYHRDAMGCIYIIYPYTRISQNIPVFQESIGIQLMVKILVKMFSEVLLPTHPE